MNKAIFPLTNFPYFLELSKHWRIIKEEVADFSGLIININRSGKTHEEMYEELSTLYKKEKKYGWVKGWGLDDEENPSWLQYYISVYDKIFPIQNGAFDNTLKILKDFEGIKTCAFINLQANTIIPNHKHPEIHEENLLQFHLTLSAPSRNNYSYLNINGEFIRTIEGRAIIFDGSYNHFAFNASNKDRIVLYIEFDKKQYYIENKSG